MSDELDRELRAMLRPVEPPEGFAERVLARTRPQPRFRPALRWAAVAAAACALFGGAGVYGRVQEYRKGVAAKRQVLLALRITGEELRHAKAQIHRLKPENP